jgi:probable rRNA maturation factor
MAAGRLRRIMIKVTVANPQEAVVIERARMRQIVQTVLEGEDEPDAEISLAFVDNPTIHQLNQRYLKHDEPTDVLSFPLSDPGARKLQGELVIGAEVAKAQAEERGHAVDAELALYVIHGILHLCGYNDHEPDDASLMSEREQHYLQLLGLPPISPDRTA